MATKVYGAYQIEGATGSLKAIDGAILNDRDLCFCKTTLYGFLSYLFDKDSGLTEDLPNIVAPATSAGDGRWILNPEDE